MDAFETLGVPSDASDADIANAYRHLARQFHPDAHPGASAAERARYEDAMARINAAHDDIKSATARQAYAQAQGARTQASDMRAPGPGECQLCGHAPAASFSFGYQVGFLLAGRRYTTEATLCRDCALAFGRAQQNKTLYAGWWGILMFFTNFAMVLRNFQSLRRAAALDSPTRSEGVASPMPSPLSPGKPLAKRGGLWFAAIAVAGIVTLGVVAAGNSNTTANTVAVPFAKGNCVSGTTKVTAVDCSDSHDGKIIAEVNSKSDCPAAADGYVTDVLVYCIDSSQ